MIWEDTAIFLYKMCTEGFVNHNWKLNTSLSRPKFCSVILKQMHQYYEKCCLYPGDEFICSIDFRYDVSPDRLRWVTFNQYLDAKIPCRELTLLCTDIWIYIQKYLHSFELRYKGVSQMCGKKNCTSNSNFAINTDVSKRIATSVSLFQLACTMTIYLGYME